MEDSEYYNLISSRVETELITGKPKGYEVNDIAKKRLINITKCLAFVKNQPTNEDMKFEFESIVPSEENCDEFDTFFGSIIVSNDNINLLDSDATVAFSTAVKMSDCVNFVMNEDKYIIRFRVNDLYIKAE